MSLNIRTIIPNRVLHDQLLAALTTPQTFPSNAGKMKCIIKSIYLCAALGLLLALPAHAQEGEASTKGDTAKSGEGGEEGGGKKKGPKDVTGGRFAGDPIYIHMDPIILSVITRTGVEQIVTIQLALEIQDLDVADDIHRNMPRVKDALMQALYGGLGNGDLRGGNMVDVAKVKTKTMAAMNNLLGTGKAKDVLIEGVSQRMFNITSH
jgi:flagellar protein FliL